MLLLSAVPSGARDHHAAFRKGFLEDHLYRLHGLGTLVHAARLATGKKPVESARGSGDLSLRPVLTRRCELRGGQPVEEPLVSSEGASEGSARSHQVPDDRSPAVPEEKPAFGTAAFLRRTKILGVLRQASFLVRLLDLDFQDIDGRGADVLESMPLVRLPVRCRSAGSRPSEASLVPRSSFPRPAPSGSRQR